MPAILDEGGADLLDEAGGIIYDETGPIAQGSWYGLVSVLRHSQQEFDAYVSRPPMACPHCGEPLTNAPSTQSASGVQLFCKYDDYKYPRDWHPPTRMGRGLVL